MWTMLEADCVVVGYLVEKKNKLYMLPHTHPHGSNIAPCRSCEEKWIFHIQTEVQKACKHKTEPKPNADMWQD